MLQVDKISFTYPKTTAPVFGYDLRLPAGSLCAVTGDSGSGKSTLLHLIAGFYSPASGHIRLENRDLTPLPPAKRPVGMIFQENNLFSHLTVLQNVGIGKYRRIRFSRKQRFEIEAALTKGGIGDCSAKLPEQLSGGQKRRVALVREILRMKDRPAAPRLLLLDEPFSGLDVSARRHFKDMISGLRDNPNLIIIYTTHDLSDISNFSDCSVTITCGTAAT